MPACVPPPHPPTHPYLLGHVVGRDGVDGAFGLVRDDLLLVQQQVQGAEGADEIRGREGRGIVFLLFCLN